MTIVVHSSDIHVDDETMPGALSGIAGLRAVIATAESRRADILLLAGDTFDNRRVSQPMLVRVVEVVRTAPMPIVLLPGNHDPALAESIFHRAGLLDIPDVHVLGLSHPETIVFERHALEITGRPHRSWADMTPLPEPSPRTARRRIVMAHGHYVSPQDWAHESHRSWLISDARLAATDADYIALGHWERAAAVGDGSVRAHYSGSPDTARSVNLVRFGAGNDVEIERVSLATDKNALRSS